MLKRPAAALLAVLLALPAAAFDGAAVRAHLDAVFFRGAPRLAAAEDPTLGRSAAQGFVDQADLDQIAADFAPPPAPGSAEDRADLAAMRDWQSRRTDAECARAQSETDPAYENLFGAMSPLPTPLSGGAKALFAMVAADAGTVSYAIKHRFKRPRPFQRDASLSPCIDKPGGYSYPSGHATLGRLYARVLSELAPDESAALMARGDEVGLDRVIGGVHHPSDVEAGRTLADRLFEQLQRTPGFRQALDSVRRDMGATAAGPSAR